MTNQHLPHQHEELDAWHSHTPDEGQPQEEHASQANPLVLGVSLLATVVFLVVVVLVIFMYFETFVNDLRFKRVENTALSKDQLQYKFVVEETFKDHSLLPPQYAAQGVVTIPLEEAKKRVVQRYAGNAPQQPEAPAPQPANQPAPPPPGQPSH